MSELTQGVAKSQTRSIPVAVIDELEKYSKVIRAVCHMHYETAIHSLLIVRLRHIASPNYLQTKNYLLPKEYIPKTSHIAKCHPAFKVAGKDNQLMAHLKRVMMGHAPIGEFCQHFNLSGLTVCPCDNIHNWT